METNHFSHEEHPLILNEVPNKDGDDKAVICYGCQEQILEPEAYSCLSCEFFLHKRCAELPRQITHPMHSQHPLILHKEPPYKSPSCTCDACSRDDWKFFTYHCSSCRFDLDVSCAIWDRNFVHESHEHPLIFQQRPAIFFCSACHNKDEDSSYVCTICPFWIHKSCASLPKTIDYKDHNHSLFLAYSLPLQHRSFYQYCVVCDCSIHPNYWVYQCGPCRYFIHLKCLVYRDTESTEDISLVPISYRDSVFSDEERHSRQNLINLPSFHAAQAMITRSLLEGNENSMQIVEVISDFSHKHPLTLAVMVETGNELMVGKEVVCDWCIEPICNFALFYSCDDCGYFVHATCVRLPDQLQILKHPEHPLSLAIRLNNVGCFRCDACQRKSNCLFYKCEICELLVCIKCASVTSTNAVVHSAHRHVLTAQAENSNPTICNGCGYNTKGFGFGCKDCRFYLDYECALLPPSTKMRWDDHPLILMYPPYFEHPDEFYCVLCEQEMNPNQWMYHCKKCDYSLHVSCIPQIRLLRNLKFGHTLRVGNHPHPLTHVQEADYKSVCEGCCKSLDWEMAFECQACKFCLCPECADEKEIEVKHFSQI